MPSRYKKIIILPLLLIAAAIQAQLPSQAIRAGRPATAQIMPAQRTYAWWVEQNQRKLQQHPGNRNHNTIASFQPATVNRPLPVYRTFESFRQPLLLKYPLLQKRSTSYLSTGAKQLPVQKPYSFYQAQAAEKMQWAARTRQMHPLMVQ